MPYENRSFQIGASIPNKDKVEILLLLVKNVNVFAWSPYEVSGVDSESIVNRLNMDPSFPLKKQKLRRLAKEHVEAVKQEVKRLKDMVVIKEVFFLKWLANTVVMKKKNGK